MAKITLEQLKAVVKQYVDAAKQCGEWNTTKNNIIGLVDKIAHVVTLDGTFSDKLEELDGSALPLAKNLEEFYINLCTIQEYDQMDPDNYAEATLAPSYPDTEDAVYSYSLGKRVIPTTIPYNDYERACNNEEELNTITSLIIKRLEDTTALFKYNCKKQIIGNAIDKCFEEMDATTATPFNASAPIVKRTRYAVGNDVYKCVKDATADTLANHLANGALIKMNLIEKIPTTPYSDSEKCEQFITKVKLAGEDSEFASEGNSLGGVCIGATEGLILVIRKGLKSYLDVEAMAGAFNKEYLDVPCKIVVVDDIPCAAANVDAVIFDNRGLKLHAGYINTLEQLNARGNFLNIFKHLENTAFISKNTFIRVFQEDASVNP